MSSRGERTFSRVGRGGGDAETRDDDDRASERASGGDRSSASGFWSRAWATRAVEVNVERSASADSRTLSDAWTRLVVAAVRSGVERCRA